MKEVILRFLLKYGHTLDVVLTQNQAVALMNKWSTTGVKQEELRGHDKIQDRSWAVNPQEIMGMFTMDYRTLVAAGQAPPPAQQNQQSIYPTFGSGL